MSYTWNDLCSKSDIFSNILPLFNKEKKVLQDNYSFKLTSRPNNGKFSLSANHTNGKKGKVEFGASETLTNYRDLEIGYKFNNGPGVELSLTATDKLIPVEGVTTTLTVSSEKREEAASVSVDYVNSSLTASLGFSLPLTTRIFNLAVENGEDDSTNKELTGEFLYTICPKRGYYGGLSGNYELPNEGETATYGVKAVLANKNNNFEGGLYAKVASDDEKQVGSWVTTESTDVTVGSHFAYDIKKNEYKLDNFAAYNSGSDDKYIVGFQVYPKPSVSFGFQKTLSSNTKVSFGYAYVLSKSTEQDFRNTGLRVGFELSI